MKHSFIELQTQDISLDNEAEIKKFVNGVTSKTLRSEDSDALPLLSIEKSGIAEMASGSGIPSAVFNLATTVIGAGIMALPATMKVLGLPLCFAVIILIGILSEISIEFLVEFYVHLKASNYGETVESVCGHSARVLSEICIIVNNAGIMIVYLIIMGDVMSGSSHHQGLFDQWTGKEGWWSDRRLIVFITMVFVLAPLCALKKIDSLKFTSAASVALAVVFVVLSSIIASVRLIEGKIERPRLLPDVGSKRAILDLLVDRTPAKMNKVGRITIVLCVLVYESIAISVLCVLVYESTAISGYLLFGQSTDSDILSNFDKDLEIPFSSILDNIIRVGYVLHLMLVFPVIYFSLRQTMDCMVFKGSKPLSESNRRFVILNITVLVFLYMGSTLIPNIWVAFQFTGATTGLSLGFIFPALIALRSNPNQQEESVGLRKKILPWAMLVMALVVSIIGVLGNLLNLTTRNN
eukprot:PITA_25842